MPSIPSERPAPEYEPEAKGQDAGWGIGEHFVYPSARDVPVDEDHTVVCWYPQGSLLRFTKWQGCTVPGGARGVRGEVRGFSRSSRRRLMCLTSSLRTRAMRRALFVTLTYGVGWPSEPAEWKSDLDRFLHALHRRWPKASVVWRMEAQKRGAPHFHLIVLGVRFLPAEWVRDSWARGRTEAKRVGSFRQAMAYVSKYVSKCDEECFRTAWGEVVEQIGRVWGVSNRALLPVSERVLYVVRGRAARFRLLARLAWSTRWDALREWPLSGSGAVFGGLSDRVLAPVLRPDMLVC